MIVVRRYAPKIHKRMGLTAILRNRPVIEPLDVAWLILGNQYSINPFTHIACISVIERLDGSHGEMPLNFIAVVISREKSTPKYAWSTWLG